MTRVTNTSGPLNLRSRGEVAEESYRIEKLLFDAEPELAVPVLLYRPATSRARPVLYVDPAGKHSPDAVELVQLGHPVLALDLAGTGETATRRDSYSAVWFSQDKVTWLALMTGRTLTGLRLNEVRRGLDVLAAKGFAGPILGVGKGSSAVALLHAAVLDSRLAELYLESSLVSYRAAAEAPVHRQIFDLILPGVLSAYDLDDLVAAVAPRKVWLVNTTNPLGQILTSAEVGESYGRSRDAYRAKGSEAAFQIGRRRENESLASAWRER